MLRATYGVRTSEVDVALASRRLPTAHSRSIDNPGRITRRIWEPDRVTVQKAAGASIDNDWSPATIRR